MVLADKELSLCFPDISEHQIQTQVSNDDILAQTSEEMKKSAARELQINSRYWKKECPVCWDIKIASIKSTREWKETPNNPQCFHTNRLTAELHQLLAQPLPLAASLWNLIQQ